MNYAYSWADGKIGFGKKIPEGAFEIAKHVNTKLLKETVKNHASDNGEFIVSVRLAYLGITKEDPVECLLRFYDYINKILERKKQRSDGSK